MLAEPYKIFIAEDEDQIANILTNCIHSLFPNKFQIKYFGNPKEVVQAVKEENVNIIITDLSMPGKFGDSLLAEIKVIRPSVMTLIVTGYPSLAVMASAYTDGVNGFLTKPFKKADVKDTLEPFLQILERWTEALTNYVDKKEVR